MRTLTDSLNQPNVVHEPDMFIRDHAHLNIGIDDTDLARGISIYLERQIRADVAQISAPTPPPGYVEF